MRRSGAWLRAASTTRDVLQVVGRHGGERDGAAQRQAAEQRRVAAAADDHGQAQLARLADVLALLLVVHGDHGHPAAPQQQAQLASPTCPSPTTTTWSERGTARRPTRPVRLRPIRRSTSPPVKAAANSSATSMLIETATLNHFGPFSTSGFGIHA